MKHCLISFAAILGFLMAVPTPADAYCVYNRSSKYVLVANLPVTSSSFKKVLRPKRGSKEYHGCCNWKNTSCNALMYHGSGNRFGYTGMVVASYSSRSKADKAKSSLQKKGVWLEVLKYGGGAAIALWKKDADKGKTAIEAVDYISNELFSKDAYCSGFIQNGAGAVILNDGRCLSNDLIPTGLFLFPGVSDKRDLRNFAEAPTEHKTSGRKWPKVDESFLSIIGLD